MPDQTDSLKKIPLFSELNNEEINRLGAITIQRVYTKRKYLFMEGEPQKAVYFIQQGTVKIFKMDEEGNEQVINLLKEGEMFPHIGFFETTPYPATAEVIGEAELLIIRNEDFETLLIEQPEIALKVMRIMGQKIIMLQGRIQELIAHDVLHRIVLTLIRLAGENGKKQGNSIRIEMPITNRDFANMIGTSRETINRVLNHLKKEELLEMDRHGILIHNLTSLKKYYE